MADEPYRGAMLICAACKGYGLLGWHQQPCFMCGGSGSYPKASEPSRTTTPEDKTHDH